MSHFNQEAANWDKPEKIELMKTLAEACKEVLNLTGPLDILDFGCGTGLFGFEFSEYFGSLMGIDTSSGMLEVFNKKSEGYPNIHSQMIDLEDPKVDIDKSFKFDLIISSMAFHHLKEPETMLIKLKSYLKEGGKIAIVDLDTEDGSFHPDPKAMGVQHFGFAENQLQKWAENIHMNFEYSIINSINKDEKEFKQFLALYSPMTSKN